ncbi:hypothetical protein GCM10023144_17510 [Pigmentiphaga soli]|uniref:TPM domain-containing protein n=1 Tax=Pigmentiphaga soli TaxID=1007095 RepID=A0ABP8GUW3_9BURK
MTERLARLGRRIAAPLVIAMALAGGTAWAAGDAGGVPAAQSLSAAAPAASPATPGSAPLPALQRRVTDLTATLDRATIDKLEARLQKLEQDKGAQIAVLMLPSTDGEPIEQYAVRLFESWKLGRKNVDDGILLVVAKNDRTLRIEVGYGLEGAVTDAQSARIIREQITPRFAQGDFAGGIEAGVDSLARLVEGEPLPPPAQVRGDGERHGMSYQFIPLLLFLAFVMPPLLAAVLAAGAAFLISGSLLTTAVVGAIALMVAGVATAARRARGGAGVRTASRRGPWDGGGCGGGGFGGGGFGGGGFGGGGGGFSGGGGSSGGGGASGRW